MKKILNVLLIIVIALCMCVALTGCGNTKKENGSTYEKEKVTKNTDIEVEDYEGEEEEEIEEEPVKKEEVVIDMPENVRIYAFEDFGSNNNNTGAYFDVIKIGNNALRTQVSTLGKNRTVQNNKGYHYFKYKGDNTWDLYYRTDTKDWYLYTPDVTAEQFNTFMNINYIKKEASELEQKEHETIHVDGLGDVDTIHIVKKDGSEDRLIDEWYSPELKRNIKSFVQYTQVGTEILTFDTSVTSFGIEVP